MASATAPTKGNTETAVVVRPEQAALAALDQELERRRAVVEASASSLIDPTRLKSVVLSVFTRRPELWECDPVTIARAVVEAGSYGLEPTGAIGGAHLVPFRNKRTGKKEAQLIIDYRGYVQLARRSGEVSKVWARVVREKDEFYVEAGSDDRLHHRPYLGQDDPGNVTHVYACIQYRDGSEPQFDWDTRAWVETIRGRSKSPGDGPWVTDYNEMAKKSILRRLLKTAPLTVEARRAIELEEQDEAEAAQHRQGRTSATIARIHDRLGVSSPPAAPEPDAGEAAASNQPAQQYDGQGDDAWHAEQAKPDLSVRQDDDLQAGMDLLK
jgi:recombination protein RecT